MKKVQKTLLVAVFALLGTATFAQTGSGFGIKGGLNYGGNGDYFHSIADAYENPDKNLGYHFGIFGKLGNRLYLRPELIYTRIKSDYDNDEFKMSKLDAPILVGAKIIGPLNVFAGPSFQYILDTDFEGITIGDVENDFTVGLNIGAGVSLGKLGIDLRYERGFTENEVSIINSNSIPTGDRIDTRPDQLILSLSLKI
ncbi:outer membrane beta-barrel protein [uncultured Kriegella sp.]|uniref:outer membrane beta-barrel protein n=1 Tax=uncultured Kriegella sp. TaxID=1798910 RepID=UPI0030DA2149|tara:strand:- start:158355 stop:158948 length:594 start_codon:yes stop_codon:yes gene_type:complete